MALRVLLADESVTIKKVFQLSLQDFGVDVFAVTSGLDVLPVAKKNRPDIIFVDVILPKKSGYDVAKEIKKDPELKNVPVVIIWSGFMELDQARFQSCGADAHLEKPFDTQKLRHVVTSLIQKTQTQSLSEFLQFPKLPDFKDDRASKPQAAPPPAPEETNVVSMRTNPNMRPPEPPTKTWNMDHFAPIPTGSPITRAPELTVETSDGEFGDVADEFVPVELPPQPQAPSRAASKRGEAVKQWTAPETTAPDNEIETDGDADSDNQWIQKTLSRYKVEAPDKEEAPEVEYREPTDKIDAESIVRNERSAPPKLSPKPAAKVPDYEASDDGDEIELDLGEPTATRNEPIPQLTDKQLEAIIRAQSKEMIEKVIWQVVPEIASQIIEREIQRLLKERQDLGPR